MIRRHYIADLLLLVYYPFTQQHVFIRLILFLH